MEAIPETVRQIVAKADPELAVYDVRTMQDRMATSMASQRFTTFLLTLFAMLGLLLTAVGLYGVLAYVVTQRTHEFGVRFALGATRGDIVWTVAGGAFALVGSGVVIGIAVASALAQIMKAALDFAGRPDALTYAAVARAAGRGWRRRGCAGPPRASRRSDADAALELAVGLNATLGGITFAPDKRPFVCYSED